MIGTTRNTHEIKHHLGLEEDSGGEATEKYLNSVSSKYVR